MYTSIPTNIVTDASSEIKGKAAINVNTATPVHLMYSYIGGVITVVSNNVEGEKITILKSTSAVNIDRMLNSISRMLGYNPGSLETFTVDLDSPLAEKIYNYLGDIRDQYFYFLQVNDDMYVEANGKLLGIRKKWQ